MVIAVILAAGTGSRMGGKIPKQFALAGGRTVLSYTIEAFERHPGVDAVAVICSPDRTDLVRSVISKHAFTKVRRVAEGGPDRRSSSRLGAEAARAIAAEAGAPEDGVIVLIHDAARPNVSEKVISDNIRTASETGACVTAAPVTDTVIITDGNGAADRIPDRRLVMNAQTPQSFRLPVILKAHERYEAALASGAAAAPVTDDAGLVIAAGMKVTVCPSGGDNFKLTVPADLERFRKIAEIKRREADGIRKTTQER